MAHRTTERLPTATTHQARLRLFQPTRRPARGKTEIVTSWGCATVTGRLGQQHADVIESMLRCAEAATPMIDEDGHERLKLLVDPARVRRVSRQTGTGLKTLLTEIMSAVIEILEPEPMRCMGHLVDSIAPAIRRDGTPVTRRDPLTGGERDMWRVLIGGAGLHLLRHDLGLRYDPAPIAALRHGVSQAAARLLLGHDPRRQPPGGWQIDTVMRQVCGEMTQQQIRDRRREMRADADALAAIGVVINGDRVRRG